METHLATKPTNLNNNDLESMRDITMPTERDYSDEGAQLLENTNFGAEGLDKLTQRDEIEKRGNLALAKGYQIQQDLENELSDTIQNIQKERNPNLFSSDNTKVTHAKLDISEAERLAHSKSPKGFINSRIDNALERGEREFLSYMYDWFDSMKPESRRELEFNHSQMDKIREYFKAHTKVYDLEERKQNLKRQKQSLRQWLGAIKRISEKGHIDTMSSWKDAMSGGQLK